MKKVCIIGSPGSGKSTFARKLGDILHAKVMHLDTFFWKPNWAPSSMEELRDAQTTFMRNERWVIEGNYSQTWDERLELADTILFLDLPRRICLYRVIKRYLSYRHQTRPDRAEGCTEKLDFEFLKYIWDFPTHKRHKLLQVVKEYKHTKDTVVLRNPQEVKQFLSSFSNHH